MDPDIGMAKYNYHKRALITFLCLSLAFELLLYTYMFFNMDYIVA